MNVLFVCSANKDRSKTAHEYFALKYPQLNFKSAGTNHKICNKIGSTPLEKTHLKWADYVFVMEHKHRNIIVEHTGNLFIHKITVLNIPDTYPYFTAPLIEILEQRLSKELELISNK